MLEAAKGLLGPDKFAAESERLRETLKPTAQRFVLTYRNDGRLEKRRSPLDPAVEEYVLPITARVDADQLHAFLVHEGFLHEVGDRPSLALRSSRVGAPSRPRRPGARAPRAVRPQDADRQAVRRWSSRRSGPAWAAT